MKPNHRKLEIPKQVESSQIMCNLPVNSKFSESFQLIIKTTEVKTKTVEVNVNDSDINLDNNPARH